MYAKFKNLEESRFIDGSEYKGTWSMFGMEGVGKFTMPHSAIFEGEFRDDRFHGYGSLYWPCGQRMDGIWIKGECKDKQYVFDDGLNFLKTDWKYCKFPDRRYQLCHKYGLKPAGLTLRTNNQDEFIIPPKCYDAGIGIFNPSQHTIICYSDLKKTIEIPSVKFAKWIKKNCQKAWSEPTGRNIKAFYKYEKRIPSTLLPFSNNSFESWWKRLTTFRQDSTYERKKSYCSCKASSVKEDKNPIEIHLIQTSIEKKYNTI
ncbi:MORN repeat-containing protein 5 isoform X1 [Apis mellifera caucasica]|uniref:MORN repeat-containing protein 5 isoform X1 n=1 Tax=Apis mellifera TaxID=7460 RepID=A0A7M7IS00_APIME|nr:MORN repeat-containing protein 5 isoform X1 [Apis mellifera]KAG6800782.1 MORN repeat-containing protein 5 isoform X1 [Apis mellifera caucasica]KAG9428448.1 MORN repeat-containing protein 5 isoform X1 [Apis mellifera carnica]|eukprot:XP_016772228.1 MORN repeat-containing protein 5 isoform X1 [Apis mellifera]